MIWIQYIDFCPIISDIFLDNVNVQKINVNSELRHWHEIWYYNLRYLGIIAWYNISKVIWMLSQNSVYTSQSNHVIKILQKNIYLKLNSVFWHICWTKTCFFRVLYTDNYDVMCFPVWSWTLIKVSFPLQRS